MTVLAFVVVAILVIWLRAPLPPPRISGVKQITNDSLPKNGLVTDGNRIYFTENPPARYTIAQASVTGGETAPVEVPFDNPIVADASPERSELLVTQWGGPNDGPYWSIPVPAGSPRRLGNVLGHDTIWAPNGKLVGANGSDLYTAEHDGSSPHKFATAPDYPGWLSFSPDGSRIRFHATNFTNSTSAIWEVRADGSNMHPVFPGWNNPAAECCGKWTPDGRYYVFQSTRDGASNIWIVPDHSNWWTKVSHEPVQLTTGPLQFISPLPSKDGKKLFVIGIQPRAELVRYDNKSGDFIPYLGGISAGDLDFSRDGQWVTYASIPEGTLWRSKLDGSSRLQLTQPPMRVALAHWSPDGQQIAFAGIVPGKPWKLFLIPKDGGNAQPVTSDEGVQEGDPTWSPDGGRIAFGVYDPFKADATYIEMIDVRSHQISQLAGSKGIFGPRWSPDGHYIIGESWDNNKLMLYDVKNQTWRQLDAKSGSLGYFAWSSDSAYLYFDTILTHNTGYFGVRISDSKVEKVADFTKIRQFPTQFGGTGSWTGLGPGDVPLLPRDISVQEIYSFDLQLP